MQGLSDGTRSPAHNTVLPKAGLKCQIESSTLLLRQKRNISFFIYKFKLTIRFGLPGRLIETSSFDFPPLSPSLKTSGCEKSRLAAVNRWYNQIKHSY